MSFLADLLIGKQIQDVLVDSEVAYVMLTNGTQISIHGLVVVEPCPGSSDVSTRQSLNTPSTLPQHFAS
jgi:hypothetical protein